MPITVQTAIPTGRALQSSDWDTLLPVFGSGVNHFSISKAILNGNIGKYIRLLPTATDGFVALDTAVDNPQALLDTAALQVVLALPYAPLVLSTNPANDPVGNSRALIVWGVVNFTAIQNLAKIQVTWKGVAYDSLVPPPPGATLGGKAVFACAIPTGTLATAGTGTLGLQIVNNSGGSCGPSSAVWRWATFSNNSQIGPLFDFSYLHPTLAAAAVKQTMQVNTQLAAGFVFGTAGRRGGTITGQLISPGGVTTYDSFSLGPSGDQTGILTGGVAASGGAPYAMTFDFSAGAAASAKIGYVGFSTNPTSGGVVGGGNGVDVITTAASLQGSVPQAAIVLHAISPTQIEVQVG